MNRDSYKEKIKKLEVIDQKSYIDLDLDRLLTYAMNVLEEENIPLYFDYICVAVFKLFPAKFSMANFSEYPDTNRISKALRRLTDQQRKNWATGNIENGFNLSEAGKEIFAQVTKLLKSPNKENRKNTKHRTRGRSTVDDTNEIVSSELFQKWKKSVDVSEFEVSSFLGATPYVPKTLLKNHLDNLKYSVATGGNVEAQTFLTWLETTFNYMFKD